MVLSTGMIAISTSMCGGKLVTGETGETVDMLLDECICTVHQSTDPAAMAYLGGMVAVLVRTSDVGQDGTGMDPLMLRACHSSEIIFLNGSFNFGFFLSPKTRME